MGGRSRGGGCSWTPRRISRGERIGGGAERMLIGLYLRGCFKLAELARQQRRRL